MPNPLLFPTLRLTAFIAMAQIGVANAIPQYALLKSVEHAAPKCEGVRELDVASDYFVEIKNPLPGLSDYNRLIGTYERKDWEKLKYEIEIFRKAFETSPLVEAVDFLEVQAKFESIEKNDPDSIKEAEQMFRKILLLYPKSKLVPVVTSNAAALQLRLGNNAKALALFESARHDFPFHELSCIFQLGIGEASFLLRDKKAASNAFNQVLQKCGDQAVRLGAEVRLADLAYDNDPKAAGKIYETNASKFPVMLGRRNSWALYNIGELKYRQGNYTSAKFYLSEFLKYGTKQTPCIPWALKRLADVSLKTKRPIEDIAGGYYTVYDKAPLADIGRYSRLKAFFLQFDTISEAERERRLKVFDDDADKILEEDLRTLIYLEKGLALLGLKEKVALSYLMRLDERKEGLIEQADVKAYIREKLMDILQYEVAQVAQKKSLKDDKKDRLLFEPLENAYSVWLKDSPQGKKALALYENLLIGRFEELIENENPKAAIKRLERWAKSGLWPKGKLDNAIQERVARALFHLLHAADDEDRKELAQELLNKKDSLAPYLGGHFSLVWATVYLCLGDTAKLQAFFVKEYKSRDLASNVKMKFPDTEDFMNLALGKSMRQLKKYPIAESNLKKVKNKELVNEAQEELFSVYKAEGRVEQMISLLSRPAFKKKESVIGALQEIAVTVKELAKWDYAKAVFTAGERAKLSKAEMVPFYSLVGRASYEKKQWKSVVDAYETALTIDKSLEKSAEIKFRLAKSYSKTKETPRARKLWEETVGLKDEIWSKLAENELKLLEPK